MGGASAVSRSRSRVTAWGVHDGGMTDQPATTAEGIRVRSALYVDLENIVIGLGKLDPTAATRFATDPARWLSWLETLTYPRLRGEGPVRRDILLRVCYLNPVVSSRHRAYFTRAGFEVIDCPPLTSAGKNSADIHLVIDVLDLLAHPTRFDEVILMSADADFTPLMLRLRAHDRRTVIVTSGPSAPAFRAACDHVVDEDTFIDLALTDPADADGPPAIREARENREGREGREGRENGPEGAGGQQPRTAIADLVTRMVADADGPISLATAAQKVRAVLGADTVDGWAGTGSFKRLLTSLDLPGIAITATPPDRLYDPDRQQPPADAGPAPTGPTPAGPTPAGTDGLDELRIRIARITDVPALTAADYQTFFTELAAELAENGYNRARTPRAVHERATTHGATIGRPTIKFVLASLTTAGHPPAPGDSAAALAAAYTDIVLTLCRNARMELSDDETRLIRRWLQPSGT
jgi:NYN domain